MKQIAEDVHLITGFPAYAINAYLVGDVLVDAMTRRDRRRIGRALRGREVRLHVLTHAHPDHQGSTHALCTQMGLPLWVGEADVPATEDAALIPQLQPDRAINRLSAWYFAGPGHPVDRALHEGDEVGDFTVLDTPGHSAGHISLWRERDRLLIVGDVLNNQNPLTGFPRGLREPPAFFTPDPERNRESIRRLGALRPETVLFGHGRPHRGAAAFAAFCASV